jgi:hypothetical protein
VPELAPPVAAHEAWPRIVKASLTDRARHHHARRSLRHHIRSVVHKRRHHGDAKVSVNGDYATVALEQRGSRY